MQKFFFLMKKNKKANKLFVRLGKKGESQNRKTEK